MAELRVGVVREDLLHFAPVALVVTHAFAPSANRQARRGFPSGWFHSAVAVAEAELLADQKFEPMQVSHVHPQACAPFSWLETRSLNLRAELRLDFGRPCYERDDGFVTLHVWHDREARPVRKCSQLESVPLLDQGRMDGRSFCREIGAVCSGDGQGNGLCGRVTWSDPNARIIEIPTPRWTAYEALRFDLDLPDHIPMTTTERAYSSPIWYAPAN